MDIVVSIYYADFQVQFHSSFWDLYPSKSYWYNQISHVNITCLNHIVYSLLTWSGQLIQDQVHDGSSWEMKNVKANSIALQVRGPETGKLRTS